MNFQYLKSHEEEVKEKIWEDHSTQADLPPHEVSIDPGDKSGKYKSSSQGTFNPGDALCFIDSNTLI